MNVGIQPRYLPLNDLFARRLFRIPDYQRAYSWSSKERSDLFGDIQTAFAKKAALHFMATIVGLRRESKTIVTDEYSVVDIVDGQQRLTTLVILYKAIEKRLDRQLTAHVKVAGEIGELLVKQDALSLLLLQTNHDSNSYFADYLRNGDIPDIEVTRTLADRALVSAMLDCEEFVDSWTSRVDLLELVLILKNKLWFIFHEIDNESAVYTVFEVLNSRGLPVAWLDRLKSALMAIAFESETGNTSEQIAELHSIWCEIYRAIGLKQGLSSEALRFAATLRTTARPSKVESEEDAVATLRERCGTDPRKAIEESQWILKVAQAVDKFLAGQRRAAAVNRIVHARLLAVAIVLRGFAADEERDLLDLWERVSFRIFGLCRKDARTKIGAYVRLAYETYQGISALQVRSRIIEIGQNEGDEIGIDWAIEHLRDANCYEGWEEELRYLMYRFEEHLSKSAGLTNEQWAQIWQASPTRTIEHIVPQALGVEKPSPTKVFVHRLGNLMLLPPGLNSQLQSRSPADKTDSYRQTGLRLACRVADSIDLLAREHRTWSRDHVVAREEEILTWVREEWR